MRYLVLIPFLALAACSGENSGWNPNYQAGATPYGEYLRERELALTGARAEPPRLVPVALPARAPTAQEIAGPSPVRMIERATATTAAQPRQAVRHGAPAVDPRLAPPPLTPTTTATPTPATAAAAPAAAAVQPVTTRPVVTQPVVARPIAPAPEAPLLDRYADTARHRPGTVVWTRVGAGSNRTACARYASTASAQTAFLTNGGPATDRLGLDPDGDGYACGWDPAPYRRDRR